MAAICALQPPRASASADRNPLFAMFCRCLDRCLLRGHERPIRRCRRCAPVSLYVAGVCLNRIGTEPSPSPLPHRQAGCHAGTAGNRLRGFAHQDHTARNRQRAGPDLYRPLRPPNRTLVQRGRRQRRHPGFTPPLPFSHCNRSADRPDKATRCAPRIPLSAERSPRRCTSAWCCRSGTEFAPSLSLTAACRSMRHL
jgi:hypothetical protein